jgi:uncharacterized RDD family membrane protein YckC
MPCCKNCGSELSEEAAYCPKCGTPVEVSAKLKLAYWGERFVAWLLDVIIIGIILIPIRFLASTVWSDFSLLPGFFSWVSLLNFGFSNVVHFLYWMLMEGGYGQSFGKMIMRLKVARLDGRSVDMWNAAIESVGKAFLLPLDCILGWLLYPKRRQRIFNYLSETIVVKTS